MAAARSLLVVALGAAPAAADPWHAVVELGGEVDSNVRRLEASAGEPEAAPLARLQAELSYRDRFGGLRTAVHGLLGARSVVAGPVTSENLLTAGVDAGVEHDGPGDDLRVLGRATHYDVIPLDGVAGTRAFASSGADLGVRLDAGEGRWASLTAGGRRLRYKPDDDFDWRGPVAALVVADEVWRGADEQSLELRASYRLERRGYQGRAYADGCAPDEPDSLACFVPTDAARADLHHVAALAVTYTGERVLAATYQLVGNQSSSFGSSFVRHRVTLSATTPAPGDIFVTAALTGQVDRYRDPLLIARDVAAQTFESIDEENRSAVSVRIARTLARGWQLEARAAFYANAFAADEREFRRLVVYGGVTWERPDP